MRLNIELLDIVQHAKPGLSDIRVPETVNALNAREGAFMTYDLAFRDCATMPSGLMKSAMITSTRFDERDWVNNSIAEVALSMNEYLKSTADRWISVGRKPLKVLDRLWVKPSIRGIHIRNRLVCPALVITRRSVEVGFEEVLPFLMRGGYEFHLRDDPNFHDFLILDLTKGERGKPRLLQEYRLSEIGMMSLSEFEHILSTYGEAAALSKYGLHLPKGVSISDLFRKPPP